MKIAAHSSILRIIIYLFLSFIAVANSSLFTIHFYLPIRNSFAHVVVPLFLGEIALHVLTKALGYLRQRDEIFGNSTVMFTSPYVILGAAESEISEPATGLE